MGFSHSGPRMGINAVKRISRNGAALATTVAAILTGGKFTRTSGCTTVSGTPRRERHNVAVGASRIRCTARAHRCTRMSYPNRTSCIGGVVANTTRVSNTVLMISTTSNPVPRAHRRVLLSHRINIPCVMMFLGGISVISSRRLLRLIRVRIHSLLARCSFPNSSIPMVTNSTLETLRNSRSCRRGVLRLVTTISRCVPAPAHSASGPFVVPVRSMFSVAKHNAITANHIRHKRIHINSRIRVINVTRRAGGAIIANIRVFHGLLSCTRTNSGMKTLLHNIAHSRVRHNRMLTGPNSVAPRAAFSTRICMLSGRRNKHRAPFFAGCHPRFCFHAASIANMYGLPRNIRVMVPNSGIAVRIRLVRPVTVRRKAGFSVHRNNHAMNTNIMTSVSGWFCFGVGFGIVGGVPETSTLKVFFSSSG